MESKQMEENLRHANEAQWFVFRLFGYSMESLENDQAMVVSMPTVMESHSFPLDSTEDGLETPAHELKRRRNARDMYIVLMRSSTS